MIEMGKEYFIDKGVGLDVPKLSKAHSNGHLLVPLAVKIQLIDTCNAKCQMCNHWRRPDPHTYSLNLKHLQILFEQLSQIGTKVIRFTGGEPTLRKDLVEIISATFSNKIIPELNTHAMNIDHVLAEKLIAAGLRRACISIHSDMEPIHDSIFGKTGAYQKAWSGLRALKNAGASQNFSIRIHTVVMYTNLKHLSNLPKLASLEGVDEIHLQPIDVGHLRNDSEKNLALLPEDASFFNKTVVPNFLEECKNYNIKTNVDHPSNSPIIGIGEKSPQTECFRPNYHILITEEGNVYPCGQLNNDELLIGNILKTPINSLLNNAIHHEILGQLNQHHPTCSRCTWQLNRNLQLYQFIKKT